MLRAFRAATGTDNKRSRLSDMDMHGCLFPRRLWTVMCHGKGRLVELLCCPTSDERFTGLGHPRFGAVEAATCSGEARSPGLDQPCSPPRKRQSHAPVWDPDRWCGGRFPKNSPDRWRSMHGPWPSGAMYKRRRRRRETAARLTLFPSLCLRRCTRPMARSLGFGTNGPVALPP